MRGNLRTRLKMGAVTVVTSMLVSSAVGPMEGTKAA